MDPLEREASEYDLAYVKLEGGRVGCMVNGAGLAMATMDITKWAGAEPANFLDIGGSADLDRIEHAFKIIVSDPDVEIILVNLFAGIARSDVVATGIINAARDLGTAKPIVAAMRGTNAEEGLQLLHDSDMDITPAPDMASAAEILRDKLNTIRETLTFLATAPKNLSPSRGRLRGGQGEGASKHKQNASPSRRPMPPRSARPRP